jgi:transposase-like protein
MIYENYVKFKFTVHSFKCFQLKMYRNCFHNMFNFSSWSQKLKLLTMWAFAESLPTASLNSFRML